MKYVLSRIQVLKNQNPATAMVYIISNKQASIPLEQLADYYYTIVCSFEQAGDSYMVLQNNHEDHD